MEEDTINPGDTPVTEHFHRTVSYFVEGRYAAYAQMKQLLESVCADLGYHRIVASHKEHRCIDCGTVVTGEKRGIRRPGIKRVPFNGGAE